MICYNKLTIDGLKISKMIESFMFGNFVFSGHQMMETFIVLDIYGLKVLLFSIFVLITSYYLTSTLAAFFHSQFHSLNIKKIQNASY